MYQLIVYGLLKDLQFFKKLTGKSPCRVDLGTFEAGIEVVDEGGPSAPYSYPVALLRAENQVEVACLCLHLDISQEEVCKLEQTLLLYEGELYQLTEAVFLSATGETLMAKVFVGQPEVLERYSRRTTASTNGEPYSWPLHN